MFILLLSGIIAAPFPNHWDRIKYLVKLHSILEITKCQTSLYGENANPKQKSLRERMQEYQQKADEQKRDRRIYSKDRGRGNIIYNLDGL
jgi:hypothetical protein